MYSTRIVLFYCVFMLASAGAVAQTRQFADCTSARVVDLRRGETFVQNCDGAVVLNAAAQDAQLAESIRKDSMITLLRRDAAISDSLSAMREGVISRLERVVDIQNRSYDSLRVFFNRSDVLVGRATANTDRALGMMRRMKLASYFSSGVLGAVAGGLMASDRDSGLRFSLGGAAGGAAVGILVSALVQEIF